MKQTVFKKLNIIILIELVIMLLAMSVVFTQAKYTVGVTLEQTANVSLGTYGFKYLVQNGQCYITSFVADYRSNTLYSYAPSDTSLGSLTKTGTSNWVLTFPSSYSQDGITYNNLILGNGTTTATNGFPMYDTAGRLIATSRNNVLITKVVLSDNIVTINNRAFYRYTALTEITLGNRTTSKLSQIMQGAFESDTKLTSVTLPTSLTYIGQSAFKGCTALTSMYLPSSVTTIIANTNTNGPFNGCHKNLRLYIEATSKPANWGQYWDNYTNNKKLNSYFNYTYNQYLVAA